MTRSADLSLIVWLESRGEHLTTDQKVGGSNPSGRATVLPLKSGPGAPSLTLIKGAIHRVSQPFSQPPVRPHDMD